MNSRLALSSLFLMGCSPMGSTPTIQETPSHLAEPSSAVAADRRAAPSAPVAADRRAEPSTPVHDHRPVRKSGVVIPPGGRAEVQIAVPWDTDGQGGQGGQGGVVSDAETTLDLPDQASELEVVVDPAQSFCYVDPSTIRVYSAIPTVVMRGEHAHIVTLVWMVDCDTGPGGKCNGVAGRPFFQDGVLTVELIRMTGIGVAERSEGRAVVRWGDDNKLVVDAAARKISFSGVSLHAGYWGTGVMSCRPEPPAI